MMGDGFGDVLEYVKKGPENTKGGSLDFFLATLLYWKIWAFTGVFVGGALLPHLISVAPIPLYTGYIIGVFVGMFFTKWVGFE